MGLKYVDLKIIKMIKNPLFSHISTHTQTHTHITNAVLPFPWKMIIINLNNFAY